MAFVFFDTETTGLRPGWDQIVQFAAIRTDASLNELGGFEARCRLQPHVIPHPQALLTNGLPVDGLQDASLPSHYEMVCSVRKRLLEWSPSIFVGYNSIAFDEHMLRHALFQCLFPAFLTSSHGNGRADALGLVHAASVFPPHAVALAMDAEHRPTFRLAAVARANGLAQRRTHDAMADAKLTLEICRIVQRDAPDAWQRFVRFSNKASVRDFVEGEDAFILTEFFGNEPYHHIVTCLGHEPANPNGRFCLDLSTEPEIWSQMSDSELRESLARKGSPIRRLNVGAAPTLTDLWDAPVELLGGSSASDIQDRACRIKADTDLCSRLISAYTAGRSDAKSPHPEDRLYDGTFPAPADEERMSAYHTAKPERRSALVAEMEDWRVKAFARRLIYAEHRGTLTSAQRQEADLDLARRLTDPTMGALTLSLALEEVERLSGANPDDPAGILPAYRTWLAARAARVAAFLAADARNQPHT